jgi:hypothetical protein
MKVETGVNPDFIFDTNREQEVKVWGIRFESNCQVKNFESIIAEEMQKFYSSSTDTPGRFLPERNSNMAPPPVETKSNLSRRLCSESNARVSPPPTTV